MSDDFRGAKKTVDRHHNKPIHIRPTNGNATTNPLQFAYIDLVLYYSEA